MGDIADDVICGFQCSGCGICFDSEHGYPVLCHDCWQDWGAKEAKAAGLQRATIPEIGEVEEQP